MSEFLKIDTAKSAAREVDGELVILDLTSQQYLAGNRATAILWPMLVDGTTRGALADRVRENFDIGPKTAAQDVDSFVAVLRNHGLLLSAGGSLASDRPPPGDGGLPVRVEIETLRLDAETSRVVTALRDQGIDSVLLKGPAIQRLLYDDHEIRVYQDIDLLVSPASFEAAVATLADRGYRDVLPSAIERTASPHERTLRMSSTDTASELGHGVCVDLHLSFGGVEGPSAEFWHAVSREAETISLYDTSVRIPSLRTTVMLIALHAAWHGPSWRRPMDDLERAVQLSDQVWRDAYRLAVEQHAESFFVAGLRLCDEGRRVAERCMFSAAPTSQVIRRTEEMPDFAEGLERLLAARGSMRIQMLIRELFPTPEFMRQETGLPRRAPLRLALAYFVRPFSLTIQLPNAVRALIAARRKARVARP